MRDVNRADGYARYMRTHRLLATTLVALLAACGGGGGTGVAPSQPAVPQSSSQSTQSTAWQFTGGPPHYRIVALASLGGSVAAGISDNDEGWISGFSLLSDNATVHAALWYPGPMAATDLGTLGGSNSAVEWPNKTFGQVVGIAQTATPDPLGEQWSCSYPAGGGFLPYTGQECRGFVWRSAHMTALAPLGGNNSFAAGANLFGQIVGWAETSAHDATCVSPQVLGFQGAQWDPNGNVHALPPLPGDVASAATAINDEGEVAGISGICDNAVGALTAEHSVVWNRGVPQKIPTLGGAAWNTPEMINDRGEVVGFSDRPGDAGGANFNAHAFAWTQSGGIADLGTVGSDVISYAYSVNNLGQIVGQSCSAGCATSRAVIVQNGTMYDLNTLLSPSSSTYDLIFANDINDEGQITGLAVDATTGAAVAFELVPVSGTRASSSAPAASIMSVSASRSLGLHLGPFGRMIPKIP